jgi:hypothetical protein
MPVRLILSAQSGWILIGMGLVLTLQIRWHWKQPRINPVGVRVVARSVRGYLAEVVPLLISGLL